jgi:hypothetical protein
LFFHLLRLVQHFTVGPTKDAPALMHQAVRPKQIVLTFVGGNRARMMPGQPIDFERDLLVGGPKGVVNQTASAIDVFDGLLMRQQLDFFEAEDLGE